MIKLFTAAILALSAAANAQQVVRFQPEPDFNLMVREVAAPMAAKDAFAGLQECGVVDAKTFRPVTVAQAEQMIAPCLKAVGTRYAQSVTLERIAASNDGVFSVQVEGIAIYIPSEIAVTDALYKDLQYGIQKRNGRILGHPVLLRRGAAPDRNKDVKALAEAPKSLVQNAIDGCMQPMVLRKVETAEDFILYYGRCITQDKSLKVRELRAAPNHPMSVTLLSLADGPTVQSLNGAVTVLAENGPVTVKVLAYPQTVYLP